MRRVPRETGDRGDRSRADPPTVASSSSAAARCASGPLRTTVANSTRAAVADSAIRHRERDHLGRRTAHSRTQSDVIGSQSSGRSERAGERRSEATSAAWHTAAIGRPSPSISVTARPGVAAGAGTRRPAGPSKTPHRQTRIDLRVAERVTSAGRTAASRPCTSSMIDSEIRVRRRPATRNRWSQAPGRHHDQQTVGVDASIIAIPPAKARHGQGQRPIGGRRRPRAERPLSAATHMASAPRRARLRVNAAPTPPERGGNRPPTLTTSSAAPFPTVWSSPRVRTARYRKIVCCPRWPTTVFRRQRSSRRTM